MVCGPKVNVSTTSLSGVHKPICSPSLFNLKFDVYFADAIEALKPFTEDGLLTMDAEHISCSETGTLLIRNIAMPFDAYMKNHAASKKTFSKTV